MPRWALSLKESRFPLQLAVWSLQAEFIKWKRLLQTVRNPVNEGGRLRPLFLCPPVQNLYLK